MKAKSRDGPSFAESILVKDFHALIDLEIEVYFRKEGWLGRQQIERGFFSGVIISVSQDADRQKMFFEIGIGPKYNRIHLPFCGEEDINLIRALKDLKKERQKSEKSKA